MPLIEIHIVAILTYYMIRNYCYILKKCDLVINHFMPRERPHDLTGCVSIQKLPKGRNSHEKINMICTNLLQRIFSFITFILFFTSIVPLCVSSVVKS